MKRALPVVPALAAAGLLAACRGRADVMGSDSGMPPAAGAASALHLRFTDLTSGPRTGGQSNKGAFVTVYGRGFGSARGGSFVTIGGGQADNYPLWTDGRITFQLGEAAASGDVVVHVGGAASNGLPFTVRPGTIYFVSPRGSDGARGDFEHPWRTVVKAKNAMGPGDISYLMDGVQETGDENYSASLSIEDGGLPDRPKALVAYPGATATIGGSQEHGIRVPWIDVTANDWVVAGLRLRAREAALAIGFSRRWRVVGNDISCPGGDGQSGCAGASLSSDIAFLGNEVHHSGRQPASGKQYHAVYFSTDVNRVEVAWNWIHDNTTCHAIQFHSSPLCSPSCGASDTTGRNQFDLSVHDNLIHGDLCSGINFATVDPSRGRVEAYNNVIYDVGNGPTPSDGLSGANCVFMPGYTNNGPPGRGTVEVYHNTCVNTGAANPSGPGGAIMAGPGEGGLILNLRNNVIYQSAAPYLAAWSEASVLRGSNNLWFGQGGGPRQLTANASGDPLFVDLAARDLRLRPGSPAIDAGAGTGLARDFDGRPRDARPDLGAYEAPR